MMKNKERRNLFMRVGAVLIVICMIAALALPALAAVTAEAKSRLEITQIIFRIWSQQL